MAQPQPGNLIPLDLLTGQPSQQGQQGGQVFGPGSPSVIGGGGSAYAAAQNNATQVGLAAPPDARFDNLAGGKVLVREYGGANAPLQTTLVDAQQFANQWWNWSSDDKNNFRSQMGLVNSAYLTATDQDLQQAWLGYVDYAARATAAGNPTNPFDLVQADVAGVNGGKGKGGKTLTKELTQTTFTSAPDANALFTAAAQSLLGRAPTADELSAFRNNLHGLEAANPIHRTQEITYTDTGYPLINDKNVSGGVNQAAQQNLALEQAKQNPDYGAYQASTTYMGALQELLHGGTV